MIVPGQEPYSVRDYLADAARAFGRKAVHEQRSYWPKYTGIKIPWSWGRFFGRMATISLGVAIWWFCFH